MKTFITNEPDNNLRDRLNTLCKYSKNIDFLVGFVYFNGLKEICESMRENENLNLRLLVGLKIDKSTAGVLFEAESVSNDNATIKEDLNQSFNNIRSHSEFDNLDSLNILELFKLFIENGRIQIRKTLEPNHAKLYLFNYLNTDISCGSMITGSSNLTKKGLLDQQEFNVEIRLDEYYQQGKEYFDELWATSKDVTPEFIEILKISETNYVYTPYETFALVLHLYLQNYIEAEATKALTDLMDKYHYRLFNYQLDAMEQAYSIIKDYNGVIIADVVGLGKSVITSMLLNKMKKRVCVICPPSLQDGWSSYLDDFEVNYKVFSQGKLDDAEAYVLRNEPQVIVIDEAHKYRNRSNDTYDQMYRICHHQDSEGNKANIILLTATPFNNNVSDILSLLKLFITDVDNSSLVPSGKLSVELNGYSKRLKTLFDIKRFREENKGLKLYNNYFNKKASAVNLVLVREEEQRIFKQVKEIIRPVIIRRNRIDLKTKRYKEAIENCSKINPPNPIYYCMTKEQSAFYDEVVTCFDPENPNNKFIGASYIPENYITKEAKDRENLVTQRNIVRFLRSLFIKRFESCFESFRLTLHSMAKYQKLKLKYLGFNVDTLLTFTENNDAFKHYINSVDVVNKYTLDNSYISKYFEALEEENEEEIPDIYEYVASHNKTSNRQNQIYDFNSLYRKHQFVFDICQDIKLFDYILGEMERLELVKTDPKFTELKKVLKEDRKGKILVFSEYKDTVQYLRRKLEESISLKDKIMYAYNSVNSSKLEAIRKEFDASYNKEGQEQENNFKILIGTDVISEGLNLNRADTIINYDIPWNPVRVIQRVGRINRIGQKVFNELNIYNFFPSEIGESLTHIKAIAENKMLLIHNSLGEDVQIFTSNERPTASGLFEKINSLDDESEKSFETIVKEDYEKIKEEHPEVIEKITEHKQFIKASKEFDKDEMLLFAFTTRLIPFTFDEDGEPCSVNLEDIYNSIKCEYDTKNIFIKDIFSWEKYEKLRDFYLRDTSKAPTRINPNSIHGKAINRLRALISKKPDFIKNYLQEVKDLLNLIQKSEIVSIKDMRELEKIDDVNDIDTLKELHKQYCSGNSTKPITINKNVILSLENRQPDIFS